MNNWSNIDIKRSASIITSNGPVQHQRNSEQLKIIGQKLHQNSQESITQRDESNISQFQMTIMEEQKS